MEFDYDRWEQEERTRLGVVLAEAYYIASNLGIEDLLDQLKDWIQKLELPDQQCRRCRNTPVSFLEFYTSGGFCPKCILELEEEYKGES